MKVPDNGTRYGYSDVPLTVLGVSNAKQWGVLGWLEDFIPHLIYGLATVGAYEALTNME